MFSAGTSETGITAAAVGASHISRLEVSGGARRDQLGEDVGVYSSAPVDGESREAGPSITLAVCV